MSPPPPPPPPPPPLPPQSILPPLTSRCRLLGPQNDALVRTRGELIKENVRLDNEVARVADELEAERAERATAAAAAEQARHDVAQLQKELADATAKKNAAKSEANHYKQRPEFAHPGPGWTNSAMFATAAAAAAAGAYAACHFTRPQR